MSDYFDRGKTGRRGFGFIFVLAVHAVLIFGLISGLAQKIAADIPQIIDLAKIDEPPPPQEEVPPPPPPPIEEPPPFVPLPDIVISTAPASDTAIRDTTAKPTPAVPDSPPRVDPRRPPSKPPYPPSAKRLEQEGPVTLQLYVGADGRVIESRVAKSSGYPALDQAALRESKNWRFIPAVTNGQKVAAWMNLTIRFRLEDA